MENPATHRPDPPCHRIGISVLLIVTILWIFGICTGIYWLWEYSHVSGTKVASPTTWPKTSQIPAPENKPTILFFAHPRCPCTRASIRELERLTARVNGKVDAYVVFVEPGEINDDWCWTDLRQSVNVIPGVHVICDRGGIESELFCARTSGLVLLYSDAGRLVFDGGITAARGHEGDNDGVAALASIILNQRSRVHQTPVFGCPLNTPNSIAQRDSQR